MTIKLYKHNAEKDYDFQQTYYNIDEIKEEHCTGYDNRGFGDLHPIYYVVYHLLRNGEEIGKYYPDQWDKASISYPKTWID